MGIKMSLNFKHNGKICSPIKMYFHLNVNLFNLNAQIWIILF